MKKFESATREKIRFEYKGLLSVEDVWDLSLEELDEIYKKLTKQKRELNEDSLIEKPTIENTELTTKIEIIKYIVETKINEQEENKNRIEKKEKKQKLLEILESKQNEELKEKTPEELKEMINEL